MLRVIQIDLLRQHALAVNLGHLRCALNRSSDQIGEVVQLPVRVLISRHRGQPRFCLGGITDERGGPTIGMDLGAVQLLHHQPVAQCSQLIVAQWRADIGADEAAAFEKVWIGDILVLSPGLHDRNKSVADQRRGNGEREGVHDANPWLRSARTFCRPRFFNCFTDSLGAQSNVNFARLRDWRWSASKLQCRQNHY